MILGLSQEVRLEVLESLLAYAVRKEGELAFERCVNEDGRPGRMALAEDSGQEKAYGQRKESCAGLVWRSWGTQVITGFTWGRKEGCELKGIC